MKKHFSMLMTIVSVAFAAQPAACRAADDDAVKINTLIARYATLLDVGTISLNWNEQPEVKKLRSFSDLKRTAAILATIWSLAKNDETIFSKMNANDYQVVVSMVTRIHSYTLLTRLTAISANDIILKEYLDQEVADLKRVFARKNTVAAYTQARRIRDNKLAVLLADPKFASELVKFRTGKETVAQSLANVTTMIAVLEACTANVELCSTMDSR